MIRCELGLIMVKSRLVRSSNGTFPRVSEVTEEAHGGYMYQSILALELLSPIRIRGVYSVGKTDGASISWRVL